MQPQTSFPFRRQTLFTSRTNGYHTYRIPGLLLTPGGKLLATVEARGGQGGDWDANDVMLVQSDDGGQNWSAPRVLIEHRDYSSQDGAISNCVLMADQQTKQVHALFCHNYNRVFVIHSGDDGATFSPPRDITAALESLRSVYNWKVVATGPGHGLQLRRGRIVVPVWLSLGTTREHGEQHLGHRPSILSSIFSDDNGQTWYPGEVACRCDETFANPNETVLVELENGSVMFNVRSESPHHRRVVMTSPDGATNWSEPQFDDALLETVCHASMIRARWSSADGRGCILFCNPDNLEQKLVWPGERMHHDRKRLTIQASFDDGQSWKVKQIIEEGPSSYSDLSVLPDETVLCLFENGLINHMFDSRSVDLVRFPLSGLIGNALESRERNSL